MRGLFPRSAWRYDLWQAYTVLQHEGANTGFDELAVTSGPKGGVSGETGDAWRVDWRGGWRCSFPARFSFPESEVRGLRGERNSSGVTGAARYVLETNFPGLLGPGGPMPLHVVESVARESAMGNDAPQDFLDIFQDRFMRLWLDDASMMCAELGPANSSKEGMSAVCAFAMAGEPDALGVVRRGTDGMASTPGVGRSKAPEGSVFENAFIWGMGTLSAAGLETILEEALPVRAVVSCFVGGWREIDLEARTRLGVGDRRELGGSAVLGSQAFDVTAGLRVGLRFDSEAAAGEFLPKESGSRYPELRRLIRAYVGESYRVVLELGTLGGAISSLVIRPGQKTVLKSKGMSSSWCGSAA